VALLAAAWVACSAAAPRAPAAETAAPDFIEGRVRSTAGAPEAGVWVIAETDALPSPYRKIVVSDDAGRFSIPELPAAPYRVWVRGYGVRDSARVAAARGDRLELAVDHDALLDAARPRRRLGHRAGRDPRAPRLERVEQPLAPERVGGHHRARLAQAGVDMAHDRLLALDPRTHVARSIPVPTRDGFATPWCEQTYLPLGDAGAPRPSGFQTLGCPAPGGVSSYPRAYLNSANPHNPMLDAEGRVWITTQLRREWARDLPAFCQGSGVIARNPHHRQLGVYDPRSGALQLIDTCYGTHHLQFDASGRLWTSGDSHVIGWFDPGRWDPERPETLAAAQGFSAVVVDSDGDARPDLPLVGFNYGVIPNPVDGSVWTAQPGGDAGSLEDRGRLVRYDPRSGRHESFVPPLPGAGPRGVDVDTRGTLWAALGGSGHLAKFERAKCQQTWGTGEQCPEGWTLYRSPGPRMRTGPDPTAETSADFHYYLWVDQFDVLGLGKDVVVVNGTGSDSLLAFDPRSEAWSVLRIPYPLNTYTRGLDGRIDDPAAGWKGRGLWLTNGLDPLLHSEIPRSFLAKLQLRPDPLAR
jgi:streptogramin lyase